MEIHFTKHALARLSQRKILSDEVLLAIKSPDEIIKRYDKYYYRKKLERGTIEVVCDKFEKSLNVITVYWV